MKFLIVGLGNIGAEYAFTRHNAGFMVLDRLAAQNNLEFKLDRHAYVTELKHKGKQIYLVKPTTYMNLSGKAVNYWMQALKIPIENVLIICDDLALPFGKLRMKMKGSHGGQNGLRNIEEVLKSANYARLRFGIGSDFFRGAQVNYVLSPFSEPEMAELVGRLDKANDMILSFCTQGIEKTMTYFNE